MSVDVRSLRYILRGWEEPKWMLRRDVNGEHSNMLNMFSHGWWSNIRIC